MLRLLATMVAVPTALFGVMLFAGFRDFDARSAEYECKINLKGLAVAERDFFGRESRFASPTAISSPRRSPRLCASDGPTSSSPRSTATSTGRGNARRAPPARRAERSSHETYSPATNVVVAISCIPMRPAVAKDRRPLPPRGHSRAREPSAAIGKASPPLDRLAPTAPLAPKGLAIAIGNVRHHISPHFPGVDLNRGIRGQLRPKGFRRRIPCPDGMRRRHRDAFWCFRL